MEGIIAGSELGVYMYAIGGFLILALFSLFGLVMFANKEPTFEDVLAAQKKKQDDLLSSLQGSGKSSGKSKKWQKLKKKKSAADKKDATVQDETEDQDDADSGVENEDPSTESLKLEFETEPVVVVVEPPKVNKKNKNKNKKSKASTYVPEPEEEEDVVVITSTPLEEPSETIEEVPSYIDDEQIELIEVPTVECLPEIIQEEVIVEAQEIQAEAAVEFEVPAANVEDEKVQTIKTEDSIKPTEQKTKKKKSQKSKPKAPETSKLQAVLDEISDTDNIQQMIEMLQTKLSSDPSDLAGEWKDVDQSKSRLENENARLKGENVNVVEQLRAQRQLISSSTKELNEHKKSSTQKIQEIEKLNDSLQKRMQASAEKHTSDMQSKESHVQALQALINTQSPAQSAQQELKILKDENAQLKVVSMRSQQLKDELSGAHRELVQVKQTTQQLRLEHEATQGQWTQAEERCNYFESQLKTTQLHKADTEKMLTQRLQEVNEQLLQSEASKKRLQDEQDDRLADTITVELESQQQSAPADQSFAEVDELKRQLEEANIELSLAGAKLVEHTALCAEHELLKQQAITIESHTDSLSQSLNEKDVSLHTLQDELTQCKSQLESLSGELESARAQQQVDTTAVTDDNNDAAVLESLQSENTELKANLIGSEKLSADLIESKGNCTTLQDALDQAKAKNNDLREKNWKAMDAVNKAESSAQDMKKEICKGLKLLHSEVSIPKEDDLAAFFVQYNENWKSISTEKENVELAANEKASLEQIESDKVMIENQKLQAQNKSSCDDLHKAQTDVEHYKKVLEETAEMLSNLQEKVDCEMTKKNDRLEEMTSLIEEKAGKIKELSAFIESQTSEKDARITSLTAQISELNTKTEANTSELQKRDLELAAARSELETSASCFSAQMEATSSVNQKEITALTSTIESLKAAPAPSQSTNESQDQLKADHVKELKEINSKLKKTSSERDLLIREYKATKEAKEKLESILLEAKSKLEVEEKRTMAEKDHLKMLTEAKAAAEAELTVLKSNGNDEIIRLRQEVADLTLALQDERDQVVITIEEPDEDLKQQLFNMSVELETEKSSKEKVAELEAKLSAAEMKIKTINIENQISEASKESPVEEEQIAFHEEAVVESAPDMVLVEAEEVIVPLTTTCSYLVVVRTGKKMGAGTDADVYVNLIGESGASTGKLSLDNTKDNFEKGHEDQFKLEATDVGKISKLVIGHNGAGMGSGWYVDSVIVSVPSHGTHANFSCDRWLDEGEDDGRIEIEVVPSQD